MKLKGCLILFCFTNIAFSQNYRGLWKGDIDQGDSAISIKFEILKQSDSLVLGMLMEPTFDFFCDSTYCCDTVHLKSKKLDFEYQATLTDNLNQLAGEINVEGKNYPLDVFRGDTPLFRPQTPKKPYSYLSEDIMFENSADTVSLAGTLTIPDSAGTFPAVILMGGSFPNDRNCEGFYHKPFQVFADYLTRKGIAVLRYDDRGIGKSTGDFFQSTPLNFTGDVNAGIEYLQTRKEIDNARIGLIGHSAGGVVVSMAAAQNKGVGFIVLLASPGIKLKEDFLSQKELLFASGEMSEKRYDRLKRFHTLLYDLIEKNVDDKVAFDSLSVFKDEFVEYFLEQAKIQKNEYPVEALFYQILRMSLSPYNRFNVTCDPANYLEKLTCPVLSLNGSKDFQVPAKINQEAIKDALLKAGNNDYTIIELEGLNHSFQKCITCSALEGKDLEETFSPEALKIIADWILEIDK